MNNPVRDVAQIRFDNALLLFHEFVSAAARNPDAATLRGLEGRFAERLQIQPSYWSQIKSRSRQIGERLARQFEEIARKPHGWMDVVHVTSASPPPPEGGTAPQTDDERFIVGLVLSYYRRHPERARERLLALLGEALTPAIETNATAAKRAPVADNDLELWRKSQSGVAPLKRKR